MLWCRLDPGVDLLTVIPRSQECSMCMDICVITLTQFINDDIISGRLLQISFYKTEQINCLFVCVSLSLAHSPIHTHTYGYTLFCFLSWSVCLSCPPPHALVLSLFRTNPMRFIFLFSSPSNDTLQVFSITKCSNNILHAPTNISNMNHNHPCIHPQTCNHTHTHCLWAMARSRSEYYSPDYF